MDNNSDSFHNSIKHKQRQNLAEKTVNTGLFFNILLAAGKIFTGTVGNSRALLVDGINSTSDVIYMIVVKVFVRLSGKPADKEHPYGHHQFENIAAIVVGAFIIAAGFSIFMDSIKTACSIFSGTTGTEPVRLYTLAAAVITIVIKILLMLQAFSNGKTTNNIAVTAIALDHRNDIFSSLAATIGIIFGISGVAWVDPLAGAVVSVIIAKTGIDILRESSADLMNSSPQTKLVKNIRDTISSVDAVKYIESVHLNKFGPYFSVNTTIGIDGDLTVRDGNKIADEVEKKLMNRLEMLRQVYIHYHPSK